MNRLLSISGGGIRGYLSIQVLIYMEKQTGKRIYDLFDCVAGTSTGSIVAIGLSQMTAEQLSAFYQQLGPAIFASSVWHKIKSLGGASGPKYDADVLQSALIKAFGKTTPMPSKALATSFDTTTWQPVVLTSRDGWSAWQVAMASASAPLYFKPFVAPNGHPMFDGGLCANLPALTALAHNDYNPDDTLVCSIGTGVANMGYPPSKVVGWRGLDYISPVLSATMDGGMELVDASLRSMLPNGQYLHLDTVLQNADMDDASAKNMVALADAGQRVVLQNRAFIDAFLSRL